MHRIRAATTALITLVSTNALADAANQNGRINNITVAGNTVLIRLDTGLPDNCTGTPYGWMQVPEASKVMQSLVLGMWMRGDAAETVVTVYTTGLGTNGYCQINQIDPAN